MWKSKILIGLLPAVFLVGCRDDAELVPSESVNVGDRNFGPYAGFYLLNQGNMGSNKCTLDYYDYTEGMYIRNIYPERNPSVVMELGDVGNDMGIYGNKLYVVVNCSNKVDVLDARTAVSIKSIDIPNCRYVRFHRGKAYISSYVGPVQVDPTSPRGAVFELDTLSLSITRSVTVGYQPEQMAFDGNYMYVANSGGYRPPEYDNTLSVIDLSSFAQVGYVTVAPNLQLVHRDAYGRLWVSSRGNYTTLPAQLHLLEKQSGEEFYTLSRTFPYCVSAMAEHNNALYFIGTEWNDYTQTSISTYGALDLRTLTEYPLGFITDGTQTRIQRPYALAVNQANGDIFVTDAKNYVSSGTLYCYDNMGLLKWTVTTGDIPAAITFVER